jgi:hypothetical protein
MSIFLGAIKTKKISKGYYQYSNDKYIVNINDFVDEYGKNVSIAWTYEIVRKSDGYRFMADDFFSSKKQVLKAVEEALKELK